MSDTENYFYSEYFNEYAKIPPVLTKKEIYDLFQKLKTGDNEAKNKLIEHNIRLVIYIVKTNFNNVSQNKKDLVSVGLMGLIKAVSTFDINKNISFSSYATICIKNEIKMYLRNNSKHNGFTVSFDELLYSNQEGKELTILDTLPSNINVEEEYINNELLCLVKQLAENLNEQDKEIIMLYFGFYDNKEYNQKEIAEKIGLSQSYTSRKIKKILKLLKIRLEVQLKNKTHIKKKNKI